MVLSHHSTRSRSAHTTTTTTINGTDIGEQNKYTNASVCVREYETCTRSIVQYFSTLDTIDTKFTFILFLSLPDVSCLVFDNNCWCSALRTNRLKRKKMPVRWIPKLWDVRAHSARRCCDWDMRSLHSARPHSGKCLRVCETEKLSTVIARCQFSQFDLVFSEIPESPFFSQFFLCVAFLWKLCYETPKTFTSKSVCPISWWI